MRLFKGKNFEILLKNIFLSPKYQLKRRAERFFNKPVEPEIKIINTLTNENLASIDIGVYRGVYSYYLLKSSIHVYSFEANSNLIKNLKKSFLGYKNITIENYAVSSSSGESMLRIPYRTNKSNYSHDEEMYELGLATIHKDNSLDKKKFNEYKVNKISIDDYNFQHKIGFIKIDVEGHELEIVKGGLNTIKKFKPNLLIEIEESHSGTKLIDTINFIESLGYDCFMLDYSNYSLIKLDKDNIYTYLKKNFDNYLQYNFIFKPFDLT